MSAVGLMALALLRSGRQPRMAVYVGIVDSINSGAQHAPASTYAYDIWVNFPSGVQKIEEIVPAQERWADDVTDVTPIAPGTVVLVTDVEGQLMVFGRELPWVEDCGTAVDLRPPRMTAPATTTPRTTLLGRIRGLLGAA